MMSWDKQEISTTNEVDSSLDVHDISSLCKWGLGESEIHFAWSSKSMRLLSESSVLWSLSFTSSSFGAHSQNQGSVRYQRHGFLFHHFILTRNLCFLLCIDAESLWDLLARQEESVLARPTFRNWPTGINCRPVSTCMTKLTNLLPMEER